MTMPKAGDRVRLTTAETTYEGLVLPEGGETLFLKLASGYNIGISRSNIHEITVIPLKKEESKQQPHTVAQDPRLPVLALLHTGGTIASKVDYTTGAVAARFSPEELLTQFPGLRSIVQLRSRLIRNMWSEDIRFQHVNLLAKEIKGEIEQGCKGVVVTIGTDNLAVVAAGLSFVLQRLSVPVILVGAQRSSDRGSSDAGTNLLAAARFIATESFPSVGICMHETSNDTTCVILPATQTRKMHTSERAAFQPINQLPYARIDLKNEKIDWLRSDRPSLSTEPLLMQLYNEKLHVGILKSHLHMYASEVRAYDGFDGLIIEASGIGCLPINEIDEFTGEHTKIFSALKDLIAARTIVAVAPTTIYGQINMNVYSPGKRMQEIGMLGQGCDLPPETAFMKLAWLLSHAKKTDIPRLYHQNIVGELSERRELL